VDHVDGGFDMLDRRRRQNAVAQVENMSIAAGSPVQDIFHPAFNFMERAIQCDRIQVPLHGAIVTDHGPCLIEMDAPINADDIASSLPHLA
jgi:hypothetical protein